MLLPFVASSSPGCSVLSCCACLFAAAAIACCRALSPASPAAFLATVNSDSSRRPVLAAGRCRFSLQASQVGCTTTES